MEKERRGREAWSGAASWELVLVGGGGCGAASALVEKTAVMLSGVPGLLMKNTLSPSSLAESSTSSAPADTDRASTSVGVCLPSGTILRNPTVLDSGRSFATLAVKKWANSGSLLGTVCGCSCADASSAVISRSGLWYCSVAERWWLVAGRRNEGRRDAVPGAGVSWGRRNEEDRFTSLFGGKGERDRLPIMGAVEPSCENAMEPFEHDTEGESGAGLAFLLDGCELDIVDSRFIHERLRDGACAFESASAMLWSLGA